jgi:Fis family transcriptional regulator
MRANAASRPADRTPAAERGDSKASSANGSAHAANGTSHGSTAPRHGGETIEQCIYRTLTQYFKDLDGAKPHQLHGMVIEAAERPLLKFALERCDGNQSAAADLLGINRNTLRKKLVEHGFVEAPPPAAKPRSNGRAPAKRAGAARRAR